MNTVRVKIDLANFNPERRGQIDVARVDATTEADIQAQMAEDEQEAKVEAAKYVRRVRRRLGLSQARLSVLIGVSVHTIRDWEQGKRCPTGAAKALFKILDRVPEASLSALHS